MVSGGECGWIGAGHISLKLSLARQTEELGGRGSDANQCRNNLFCKFEGFVFDYLEGGKHSHNDQSHSQLCMLWAAVLLGLPVQSRPVCSRVPL